MVDDIFNVTFYYVLQVWHGLLFHCRLLDPIPSKCVPLTNYHRPFYTAAVER